MTRAAQKIADLSAPGAPHELERLLRERYPSARVSPQDPLASFTGDSRLWYVYRRDAPHGVASERNGPEGSASAADTHQPAAPGSARLAHTARPIYSAAAVVSMVGVPMAILVGWDEGGLVTTTPTPSGHRLYSRDDLEDLLTVKRLTTGGRTPAEIQGALVDERARRQAGPFGLAPSSHRMLVLLAERDPYAAEIVEYFLRTEGYDVEVSFSMAEAEATAIDRAPDVAVVELLLSGGAGAELCARLKAQTNSKIVAISTLDFEDAALRSGADAFLRKPFDPLELVSTIRDLLGESALLRPRVGA